MAKCLFCDSSKLSLEHVYPKWLFTLIGGLENERFTPNHHMVLLSGDLELSSQYLGNIERGSNIPYTKFMVRCVCAGCNNGWMSRLENDVKPIITKLFYEEIDIDALSEQEARILARWALLRTMIIEQTNIDPVKFADEVYSALRSDVIVDGFAVELIRSSNVYLDYFTNGTVTTEVKKMQMRALTEILEGFYMAGFQVGHLVFRITYLDSHSLERVQVLRKFRTLHPSNRPLRFSVNSNYVFRNIEYNPNLEMTQLLLALVLKDKLD